MTLKAKDVTAVIRTRGDVDLTPILDTLPYGEVIVSDETRDEIGAGVAGRYLAALRSPTDIIFFQDDDLIFTRHDELMAAYKPGSMCCNMPSPWYERTGYDTLNCGMVGAGSLTNWRLPHHALARYEQAGFPQDECFHDYVDIMVGMLTPHVRHDFGYQILDYAEGPGRIHGSPGHEQRRQTMIERALTLR